MDMPRLRGYPLDPDLARMTRMEREARRARRRARPRPRPAGWLARLLG